MTVVDEGLRLETSQHPDHETARDVVSEAIEAGALVTVVGRCTVDYEGRASSTLGPGERLVMLKPDGAALVHTDEGQQPVNWQPPDCEHEATLVDGRLLVESHRETPEEHLAVSFESVLEVSAYGLTDERDLSLEGTEEDLRQRILDDPTLIETGFVPLATERQTPAGAVDIYGEDGDGRAVAVELKRRRVGPDAVGQLGRYVDAMDRDLHADTDVRGILVAPSVTDRASRLLAERGLEFVPLTPTGSAECDT
ncbi:endonuclease NucS [Halobacteriales archaeon QH_8_67_27]|nr:MAG: endonuclease NucS [Halobacteriales archaeon QH_8_67_27]